MQQIKLLCKTLGFTFTSVALSACNLLSSNNETAAQVEVIQAQPIANEQAKVTANTKSNAKNNAKAYAMLSVKEQKSQTADAATQAPLVSTSIANLNQENLQGLIDLNKTEEEQEQIELLATDTDISERPDAVGENLPTYASDSNLAVPSCDVNLQKRAKDIALELTGNLIERYNGPKEHVYVAATIINSKYSDCLADLKNEIVQALIQKPRLTVVNDVNIADSYAAFSQSSIPNLIAQCRKNNIPHLVISNIKDSGNHITLNIRFIRVNDGITLFQSSKNIK